MQDIFYEESTTLNNANKESAKYNLIKFGSILSYFIAFFWLVFDFYFLNLTNVFLIVLGVLPIGIFVFLGVVLGKLKDRFSIVYDYTFITGSIRISKVIRNVKRKSVIKFECSDIEKIGKISSDSFASYYAQKDNGVNYICATTNQEPSEGKSFYYIALNVMGQKTLIKLECTKEFIINIIKFSKRTVIDGELLK